MNRPAAPSEKMSAGGVVLPVGTEVPTSDRPPKVYPPALKTLSDPIISAPIEQFWAPGLKVESPHRHLIPEETPDPSAVALDRERVLSEGAIPSVIPAALGLRAWLAERRITRYQRTAETLLGRRAKVAAFVGQQVINHKGYKAFDKAYRPQSTAEQIMAWRMQAKYHKANIKNAEKNHIAASYLVPKITRESSVDRSIHPDFKENFDNLSR
ncbi:MAG: hypothetical protein ACREHG_00410, partial [Candidatus Saccharimonadales bacterium]